MTSDSRPRLWARLALATGVLLFALALRYTDWTLIRANGRGLALAAVASILISGGWHVARTVAWRTCFPATRPIPFARLFRVRLAAEAVSYVTVRGVAGEPLKVVLLRGQVDAPTATAAVALERLAYIIFTTLIVGAGAFTAWLTLSMSAGWSRTFLAFAAGSVALAVLGATALFGRGGRRQVRSADSPPPRSIVAKSRRFVAQVAERLVVLARGDRRRAMVLAAAACASYALMSLEAWTVFWIAGAPVTFGEAVAIETITRVASFASAAIPGNLGALEAASLAAAAAVGSPSGAFLALARRVRGLFWAGLGFLIYPREAGPLVGARQPGRDAGSASSAPVLLFIAEDRRIDVSPVTRLAGLPIAERIVRAALKAGYGRIIVLAPRSPVAHLERLDPRVTVVTRHKGWMRMLGSMPRTRMVTAVGPGTVVSSALLTSAADVAASSTFVDVSAGPSFPISGVIRTTAGLAHDVSALSDALVERVAAGRSPSGEDVSHGRGQLAIRVPSADRLPEAEAVIRRATYKETDARLARFNRRLSLPVSIALLRTPVTANTMSVFVFALGLLSAWLFSRGEYLAGVAGGVLSLAASILDGCDGEIARLKYQESALGCWLETIGDYSYYLAIFVGLTVGAVHQTGWPMFFPIGAIGLAGTVLSFLLLIFLRRTITQGRPETLHAIAKARFKADPSWWSVIVWRISFVATRAAMPYGILALALINLLPLVVVLSAVGANVYWLSLAMKLRNLLGLPAEVEDRPSGTLASQT